MTSDQKKAYEWAKNQNYPSVAARYAKELAGLVDELQVASCARQDQERNAPLTLDELRQMDGEPVYCVEITGREEWLFRRDGGFADMYGEFTSDDFMSWDNYGKLWWCYRQKPEEGTV
jgi:hypothetical protein